MTKSNHSGRPRVWFDLDDTLWDFEKNSLTALTELYHRRGLESWWPTVSEWLDAYHAVNSALWQKYNRGEITAATLRRDRFLITLRDAGYDGEDIWELAESLDREYLHILSGLPDLVAGVAEGLPQLSTYYNIGILSNGFADTQHRKLRSGGIDRFVDITVLSDDIGVAKPDRRLFDHAASVAGEKGKPLMVGDNPETDIAGALNAGWDAIWFNPRRLPAPSYIGGNPGLRIASTIPEIVAMLLADKC